jgi:ATP-dependent Clp protease, protease subunit
MNLAMGGASVGRRRALPPVAISLCGPVERWPQSGFSSESVCARLRRAAPRPLHLVVDSQGGDAEEGLRLFEALLEYGVERAIILGETSSVTALIVMTAARIEVSPEARIVIHDAYCEAPYGGKSFDTPGAAAVTAFMADVFARRTGIPQGVINELMFNDTSLTAREAVSMGFADGFYTGDESASLPSTRSPAP